MSTELSKLPSDPSVPSQGGSMAPPPQVLNNIKMETTAYKNDLDKMPSVPPIADTKQMNSMVTEIQNAAKQGLTRLSEDIPQQTAQVLNDPQTIPNAIPDEVATTTPIDYIKNTATQQEVQNEINKQKNRHTTVETILEEMKFPLLIALLYYVFQTKCIKKMMTQQFPSLLNNMGGYSTNGQFIVSTLFAIAVYSIFKLANYFDLN